MSIPANDLKGGKETDRISKKTAPALRYNGTETSETSETSETGETGETIGELPEVRGLPNLMILITLITGRVGLSLPVQ